MADSVQAAVRNPAQAGREFQATGVKLATLPPAHRISLRAPAASVAALSKALGCPVGSLLAGDADTLEEAWRVRRRFGGALRQSGLLAAAGLYALAHHRSAVADDHVRARRLADGVGRIPRFRVVEPETNVVLIELETDGEVVALLSFLKMMGILMLKFGTRRLRAVTHRDVDDGGIKRAVAACEEWAHRQPDT